MKKRILPIFLLLIGFQIPVNSMVSRGPKIRRSRPGLGTMQPLSLAKDKQDAIDKAEELINEANQLPISPQARTKIKQAIEVLRPFAPATSPHIINIYNNRIEKLWKAGKKEAALDWLNSAKKDQAKFNLSIAALDKPNERFEEASQKLQSLEAQLMGVQPTAPTQDQEAAIQQADSLIQKANAMRPSPQARALIIQAIQTLRPFAPATSAKIISIYNTRIQQLINARLGMAAREWLGRALQEQAQLATAASGQPEFDAATKTLQNLKTLFTRTKRRGR